MPGPFKRPRGRRLIAALLGGGLLLAVIAFLLIYFVLFPTSSPKPFKLTPARTAATSTASGAPATTGASAAGALSGSWRISSGSLAGYRVREKLAFLPAQSDAVGRTSQITGEAVLSEAAGRVTISQASFAVAVNTLTSDRSMRDEKIHQIGLESDRFPTATFALAAPLHLTRRALEGHVAHISASGIFLIHGVSKTETLPLELSLSSSTLEAAGSLTFPWSEFGMTAPSVGGFVNVTGKATLEFDLRLQRG
jgi:polyisoprenoid-binding protein YceI